MARNIEIKARINSCSEIEIKLAKLNCELVEVLLQDDTFFTCADGRLKLREFEQGAAELIYYRRDDTSGPKESFYLRSVAPDPGTLRESLKLAYGIKGRVEKTRHLYLHGRTRIHVDRVHSLGDFLELEVVMQDEEDNEVGVVEAYELLEQLEVEQSQLVETAYIDLLAERA